MSLRTKKGGGGASMNMVDADRKGKDYNLKKTTLWKMLNMNDDDLNQSTPQ